MPSPTNLTQWELSEDPTCPLCMFTNPYNVIQSRAILMANEQEHRETADVIEREKKRENQLTR